MQVLHPKCKNSLLIMYLNLPEGDRWNSKTERIVEVEVNNLTSPAPLF